MRWSYPLMRNAPELSPKKFRRKTGATSKFSVTGVVENLQDGMTTGQWQKATCLNTGMVDSTFFKLKKQAIEQGQVEERKKKWFHNPKIVKVDQSEAAAVSSEAA
jgi:hypothetical protein